MNRLIGNIILVILLAIFIVGCDGNQIMSSRDLENIPFDPEPYVVDVPDGFPILEIPEDNPMTLEGVELGRRLFYDPILSADNN